MTTANTVFAPEADAKAEAAPEAESLLWESHPSVWANPKFGAALGLCLFVIGIPWALWLWLEAKCTTYQITTERLIFIRGILTKHRNQTELYRVRDVSMTEPWYLRPLHLGRVLVLSSDASTPNAVLAGIERPEQVMNAVRQAVEAARDRHGIRAVDFETMG